MLSGNIAKNRSFYSLNLKKIKLTWSCTKEKKRAKANRKRKLKCTSRH